MNDRSMSFGNNKKKLHIFVEAMHPLKGKYDNARQL